MTITPDSTVRLKSTALIFTVIRTYRSHEGDEKWEEEWAELKTENGSIAHWKTIQLEEVSP